MSRSLPKVEAKSSADGDEADAQRRRSSGDRGLWGLGKLFVDSAAKSITAIALSTPLEVPSFENICEKLIIAMKDPTMITEDMVRDLETIEKILKDKEICISVFGHHNCGKSTLLNAFIGDEYLPVGVTSETSVKVKIQHDSSIHLHACSEDSCKGESKSCPKLHVLEKSGKEDIITGADAIFQKIQSLNEKIRKEKSEQPEVVLRVNLPMLSSKVPPGWTVSLVDNPGFGDACEHISQLASASMIASSAYIYLMQTEYIGGKEVQEFFKELVAKDHDALTGGRFAVGISKMDIFYETQRPENLGRVQPTSLESIQSKVLDSVQERAKTFLKLESAIPLSGKWALAGERLGRIHDDETESFATSLAAAQRFLEEFPELSLPGGEGQSQRDIIRGLSRQELIEQLGKASGLANLKEWIKYRVENVCIKIWALKILSGLKQYEEIVIDIIHKNCKDLEDDYKVKEEDLSKSKAHYNKILQTAESIRAQHSRQEKSQLWLELKTAYRMDLKNYEPQIRGKEKVKDLVEKFKELCKEKIKGGDLGPKRFEKEISEFLDDSASSLQRVFDSSLGFWNMQQVVKAYLVKMCDEVNQLSVKASQLCTPEEELRPIETSEMSQSEIVNVPNLSDIKSAVHIPNVSIPLWETFVNYVLALLHLRKAEKDDDDYKRCTTDIKEAISEIQKGMEGICESYFKTIESKAIDFFFTDVVHQTNKHLNEFDRVFGRPLKKEHKQQSELSKQLRSIEVKVSSLKEKKESVHKLGEEMYVAFQREFLNHIIPEENIGLRDTLF